MEVRHCPNCGSDAIEKQSASFEYGGSTRWNCDDCDWRYKQGRGIGTGTENAGTHPRDVGSSESVTTGEYCHNCETVIRPPHACTPTDVLRNATEDVLDQQSVIDALDEFHLRPTDEIEDAIKDTTIILTPTFYQVREWPDDEDPALFEVVYDEIERAADDDGGLSYGEITNRMAAENSMERQAVRTVVRELERNGRIQQVGFEGFRPRN